MNAVILDDRGLMPPVVPSILGFDAADEAVVVGFVALIRSVVPFDVFDDAERRAVVRRLANDPDGLPAHVRSAPSFAARVVRAMDDATDANRAFLAPLLARYETLTAFANATDLHRAIDRLMTAPDGAESAPPRYERIAVAPSLVAGADGFRIRRALGTLAHELGVADAAPLEVQPAIDPRTIGAVRAAFRYLDGERDEHARALAVSTLSPIPLADARGLCVVAARKGTLLETIAADRLALAPASRTAAHRFASALRTGVAAYRAPNAGAASTLAALVLGLGIAKNASLAERTALAVCARIARAFDRALAFGATWEASAFIDALDAETHGMLAPSTAESYAAPAPIVHPEHPMRVHSKRSYFSASSLNTYAECLRKWYFRYVCSAIEDKGSSASFYGTAFHAALEDFHIRYPRPGGIARAELERYLEGCVNQSFARYRDGFSETVEYELQRRRAVRTAKKYVAWIEKRAAREPFEVVGNELSAEMILDGYTFVGSIDRLDRDDRSGATTVIDYKTGTIAESARAYRDKVLAFKEFQLPFYYWARTAAGDRVARLALVPLKDALLDIDPIELEVVPLPIVERGARGRHETIGTIAVRDLERAKAEMLAHCRTISDDVLEHYPATDDVNACAYCAYANACRERPSASEERFGR